MELVKDTPFEVAWQVWVSRPARPCLTVVVKGTFDIVRSGTCPISDEQDFPGGDQHHDDDLERSVRYESDFAFLKPQGECYVVGSCYTPGKRPAPLALAAFMVGPVSKKMAVIGDRYFKGVICGQTQPEPFTVMPLCWERCFGGRKIPENPVGLGTDKSVVGGKKVIRLPNIEDPEDLIKGRFQRPKPAGAFPIPRTWRFRTKHAGTYDARWLRTRWPWLPNDFEWAYFNAAPEDQRIKGYFRGDEEISLVNLHPEHDKIHCFLPGLRAMVMLKEGADDEPRVITPDLDTIIIDSDAGKIRCLWRAVVEIPSESLDEFSHLFVLHEQLSERHSNEDYQARFERRLAELEEERREAEAEEIPRDVEIRASDMPPAVATEVAVRPDGQEGPWTAAAEVPDDLEPLSIEIDLEPDELPAWAGRLTLTADRPSALPDPVRFDSPVMEPLVEAAVAETPLVDLAIDGGETDRMDLQTVLTAFESAKTDIMDTSELMEIFAREAHLMDEPLSFEADLTAQKEELERMKFLIPAPREEPRARRPETSPPPPAEGEEEEWAGETVRLSLDQLGAILDGDQPGEGEPPEEGESVEIDFDSTTTNFLAGVSRPREGEPPEAGESVEIDFDSTTTNFLVGVSRPREGEPPEEGESVEIDFDSTTSLSAEVSEVLAKTVVLSQEEGEAAQKGLALPATQPQSVAPPETGDGEPSLPKTQIIHPADPATEAAGDGTRAPSLDLPETQGRALPIPTTQITSRPDLAAGGRAPAGEPPRPVSPEPTVPVEVAEPQWAGPRPTGEEGPGEAPAPATAEPRPDLDGEGGTQRRRVVAALAAGESCAGWDLSEADLSGLDLSRGDFTGALLSRANLRGAALDEATFDRAAMVGVTLTGATLRSTSFVKADLTEATGSDLRFEGTNLDLVIATDASFPGAELRGCQASGAELSGVDLRGATFDHVKLDKAFLAEAKLDDAVFIESSLVDAFVGDGAQLRRAKLEGCDLTGLRAFAGSDFTGASFKAASINGGEFAGSICQGANFSFAKLERANFSDADLEGATLMGCRLGESLFVRAKLERARLGSSDLHESNFQEANLRGADFTGANLYGSEFYKSITEGAVLELANLMRTKLA